MGAEIAQVISFSGVPVLLKDVDQARVDKGLEIIRKIYQRRVDRGKMAQDEMEQKVMLVSGVTDYRVFKDIDLVVEAVPEQMPLKQQIVRELDQVLPESSIIASNTAFSLAASLDAFRARARPGVAATTPTATVDSSIWRRFCKAKPFSRNEA